MGIHPQRPGEEPPAEVEPRFERMTFSPEQRRLVGFIVVLALVALGCAAVSIAVVVH
jgi:hypothetical protein